MGSYSWAGVGMETFSIGSICYSLAPGFPYTCEGFYVQTLMKKLKARESSTLGSMSDEETIRSVIMDSTALLRTLSWSLDI